MLTVSQDHTARLWESATGHAVSDPFRHEQMVMSGQWAADGASVLTASFDRTAKLWPVWLIPEAASPDWLANLAESSGGLRREGDGTYRKIGIQEINGAHRQFRTLGDPSRWGRWLEAFYAEPPGTVASKSVAASAR